VKDLDNDKVPDLIISAMIGDPNDPSSVQRWVETISGKTGTPIWKFDLPSEWFQLPTNTEVPFGMRHALAFTGNSSGGSGGGYYSYDRVRDRTQAEYHTSHFYAADAPIIVTLRGSGSSKRDSATVMIVAGDHVVRLRVSDGQPAGAMQQLTMRPSYPARWADVDGDGMLDAITLEENGNQQLKLSAWSPSKEQRLWEKKIKSYWLRKTVLDVPIPEWPVIDDLDGDGAADVLIPNGSSATATTTWNDRRRPSGDIELVDGRTGKVRWQYRVRTADQQVDHFLAGTDVDGDGWRDVFVASLWGNPFELYLEAVSGKNGRPIWIAHRPIVSRQNTTTEWYLRDLRLWDNGGVPLLVALVQSSYSSDLVGYSIRGADGQWIGELANVLETHVTDVDGDELSELLMVQEKVAGSPDQGLTIDCLRGHLPELYRRLGANWKIAADYDSDGVRDWVARDSGLSAMSGATGEILWSTKTPATDASMVIDLSTPLFSTNSSSHEREQGKSPPSDDLNGDKIPDLMLIRGGNYSMGLYHSPLFAVSGKKAARPPKIMRLSHRRK
jgi:hypothetical protein